MHSLADVRPEHETEVLAMKETGHRDVVRWLAARLDPRNRHVTVFEELDWATFHGLRADVDQTDRPAMVVVRDLPNFIASRLAAGGPVGPDVVRAWVSHVQAALDALPRGPVVFVDYPAWYRSEDYRARLLARLGVSGDSGLGTVALQDNRPWDRWREFALDPRWREICLHPDLRALSGSRFGDPLQGL